MKSWRIAVAVSSLLMASPVMASAQTPSRSIVTPGMEQQLTVVVPADQIAHLENDLSSTSATTESRRLWIAMPYTLFVHVAYRSLGLSTPGAAPTVESLPTPGLAGSAPTRAQPQGGTADGLSQSGSHAGPAANATPVLSALTSRYKALLLVPVRQLEALRPLSSTSEQAPVIALPLDRMSEIVGLSEPDREQANFSGPVVNPPSNANREGGSPGQDRVPVLLSLDELRSFNALPGVDQREVTILLPFDEFPRVVNLKALPDAQGQ